METLREPPPLGASGGSLLASKPGLFLASAEVSVLLLDIPILMQANAEYAKVQ